MTNEYLFSVITFIASLATNYFIIEYKMRNLNLDKLSDALKQNQAAIKRAQFVARKNKAHYRSR